MTENLLEKFEEKLMAMITELESVRRELKQLRQENENLKCEKNNYTKKIQDMLYLFEALEAPALGS